MIHCEFLFDFGSPNSYLAWKLLPAIEARSGIALHPVPVLLGGIFKATGNSSPAVAYAGIKNKLAYEMLEMQRFITKHQLTQFKMNPHFPVNTLMLMRGAVFAQRQNMLPSYMAAMMHHMWEEPKKLDDPETFAAALEMSGLSREAFAVGICLPEVKTKLIANTETAVARGAFGAPTFFVGDEMFFGKDRLLDVEDAMKRQ